MIQLHCHAHCKSIIYQLKSPSYNLKMRDGFQEYNTRERLGIQKCNARSFCCRSSATELGLQCWVLKGHRLNFVTLHAPFASQSTCFTIGLLIKHPAPVHVADVSGNISPLHTTAGPVSSCWEQTYPRLGESSRILQIHFSPCDPTNSIVRSLLRACSPLSYLTFFLAVWDMSPVNCRAS